MTDTLNGAKTLSGGCLCGDIRYTAAPREHKFLACHCAMCRRWTSGPLLAVHCGRKVQFEDETRLGVYRSSEWAERLFCRNCGTSIAYRLTGSGHVSLSIETLDDSADFKFASEIFVDEKSPHYDFANDTEKLTGAAAFAKFGATDPTQLQADAGSSRHD